MSTNTRVELTVCANSLLRFSSSFLDTRKAPLRSLLADFSSHRLGQNQIEVHFPRGMALTGSEVSQCPGLNDPQRRLHPQDHRRTTLAVV